MATDTSHRSVEVQRLPDGSLSIVNDRGGRITLGRGDAAEFSPVELLLGAIGGCTAIDVDILTSRRSEPESFLVLVDAEKVRDASGNRLTGIEVTFKITFPGGERGDAARALLPDAVRQSRERLCTVGRTVELGTPITTRIE
jgi:putative redox protein